LIKKAISIGVTAALLGSLMVALVPSVAVGATATITKTADIPRGNDFVGTSSIKICEDVGDVDEWDGDGYTILFAIRDSENGTDVAFDESAPAPTTGPDSVAATFSWATAGADRVFVVEVSSTNESRVECLTINGLKISAGPDAALGDIQLRYSIYSSDQDWDMGGDTRLWASGKLGEGYGVTEDFVEVVLDIGPYYHQDGDDLGRFGRTGANASGPLAFLPLGPAEIGGSHAEDIDVINPINAPSGGVQDLNLAAPGFTKTHAGNDPVVQNVLLDCVASSGGFLTLLAAYTWERECNLAPIGTVVDALWAGAWWHGWTDLDDLPLVQRGLQNSQEAAGIIMGEWKPVSGEDSYIPKGKTATVTLALDPAMGVRWSSPIPFDDDQPAVSPVGGTCQPSSDRFTLTCLIGGTDETQAWAFGYPDHFNMFECPNDKAVGPEDFPVDPCGELMTLLDASAASPAAADVMVKITVTGSTYLVFPSSVRIARLNNVVGATADMPNIIIGENDQQSGTISLMEGKAGVLGDPEDDMIGLCYKSAETFTRAPWLVVTAGDMKLRNPSNPDMVPTAAAPGTPVQAVLKMWSRVGFNCAFWIIYNKSTVASTLEIRGSAADGTALAAGAAHGPQLNVGSTLRPGPSIGSLNWGDDSAWEDTGTEFNRVANAVRVFGGTPVVTAISNPEIWRGMTSQAAGDVTVTEVATHQFGRGEEINFTVLPNNLRDLIPSVRFDTNRGNPVVSTNAAATGLIAHFDGWHTAVQFEVEVDQRAFVPIVGAWVPGVITVSGMRYITTNDAAYGNILLDVCTGFETTGGHVQDHGVSICWDGFLPDGSVTTSVHEPRIPEMEWADFDQVVSNAHVVNTGLFPSMSVAAGYKFRETSPYKTFGTLVVPAGTYITNKVYIGPQFQGKAIEFWQRNGKTGTWVKRTTGRVDGKGYAYWSTIPPMLSGTGFARYVYYRSYFAGTSEVAAAYSQTITRVVVK
jgi:hypothetical protein